MSENLFETA